MAIVVALIASTKQHSLEIDPFRIFAELAAGYGVRAFTQRRSLRVRVGMDQT
jgi:hypothetical protein